MMLPTHAVVGLALATPLALLAPEFATAALTGGFVGGVLPDLDLYAGHRRSLHYPTGYTLAAIFVGLGALLLQTQLLVALAFLLVGAAAHCRMDRYGGGLELRPWEETSERAVYDHVRGRWRTPKRWIRYDGSPQDIVLLVVVSTPVAAVLNGPFQWVVLVALLVGGTYGLLRQRLAELAPTIFEQVP
ncbi:metal-dependent hydrolase [Haloarcula sp. S1CR25-12]|uniref:Metal-dependent hydrolase n=1 Tax=Haloarcula saliterrae TaxID=2950534 RepID=A0ABU2FFG1_9EURY|nr:metal-dependent hydrolase [Haloarcula sp. S1CR25-12]MDS0260974.1 metal-dependent hydrolase [Haloarcula sp. S1CR25-12]